MKWLKWLYPGMNLKRWLFCFAVGAVFLSIGVALLFNFHFAQTLDEFVAMVAGNRVDGSYGLLLNIIGLVIVFLGCAMMMLGADRLAENIRDSVMPEEKSSLRDLIFARRRLQRGPSIVVLGGGTGLSVLLRGLKHITSNLTAVVTTGDNGGSSGRLRKEMGIIPPGDMRNCLVAMADTEPTMEKVMQYRFKTDSAMEGHNLGNLFIAALAEAEGSIEGGLNIMGDVLKVRGQVIPVSTENLQLKAEMLDGSVVLGESEISECHKGIRHLYLEPENPKASQNAINAIINADAIILGPGSLYTSVIASLIVPGIREALLSSKATKIYVCNVMTQPGETTGYGAFEHVQAIVDHVGKPFLDYVVVNGQMASTQQLEEYKKQGSTQVSADVEKLEKMGITVVKANLLNDSDLVRHNPIKLAESIISLIYRLRLLGYGFRTFDFFLVRDSLRNLKNQKDGK